MKPPRHVVIRLTLSEGVRRCVQLSGGAAVARAPRGIGAVGVQQTARLCCHVGQPLLGQCDGSIASVCYHGVYTCIACCAICTICAACCIVVQCSNGARTLCSNVRGSSGWPSAPFDMRTSAIAHGTADTARCVQAGNWAGAGGGQGGGRHVSRGIGARAGRQGLLCRAQHRQGQEVSRLLRVAPQMPPTLGRAK